MRPIFRSKEYQDFFSRILHVLEKREASVLTDVSPQVFKKDIII